jgi:hypothetical protein
MEITTTTEGKSKMSKEDLKHLTYLYEILTEAQGSVQVDAAIDAIEAFKAEVAR